MKSAIITAGAAILLMLISRESGAQGNPPPSAPTQRSSFFVQLPAGGGKYLPDVFGWERGSEYYKKWLGCPTAPCKNRVKWRTHSHIHTRAAPVAVTAAAPSIAGRDSEDKGVLLPLLRQRRDGECNSGSDCPPSAPCCSHWGYCGSQSPWCTSSG